MADKRDPNGENPTEAFLNTLGDAPVDDGGHPKPPRIDTRAFASHLPLIGKQKQADGNTEADKFEGTDSQPLEGSDAEAYEALKRRRAERRKKKLIRRGIVAGVIVAVAAVAGGIWWFTSQQAPEQGAMRPVTEVATRGTYLDSVDAKGTLEPNALTVVSAPIDGTIASVDVTEGQHVDAGAKLLTISNDELDAAVNDAVRAVNDAKTQLNVANMQLNEAKKAASTPNPSVTDPETGEVISGGGTMGSQAEVANAQAAVSQAQGQVDSANAALAAAQAKAAQRTVTAPAAGSIVNLNAKVGASLSDIAAGTASSGAGSAGLMQIADLSKMKVTVQVGEEDIAKVAVDQQATVTFPAFEDISLTGRVTGIASVASTDASGMSYGFDGSPTPTFAVDILIDEPDARLKPGMTAQVQLVTKQLDDVITVPLMALLTDDGTNHYVNVLKDPETGETERHDVEVVAQNDDVAVIGRPKDAAIDSNPDLPNAPIKDGDTLVVSGGADFSNDGTYMSSDGSMGGGRAVM